MMGIEENIAAREAAEEALGFCREVEQEKSCTVEGWDSDRFWVVLNELIVNQKPQLTADGAADKQKAFTDVEASRFGHQPIPFGEFAGRRVDDVPLERLHWYADQRFTDDLRRYLRSGRIQREEEE